MARRAASFLAACLVALWLGACEAAAPREADILLYSGEGASPNDVNALRKLLDGRGLSYATAGTRQFEQMGAEGLKAYRLLIVPGGNFEVMGNALTPEAAEAVRQAVHGGTNYLGICAGGFIAGASPYNGFDLTEGRRFGFYSISAQGVRKAAVRLDIAGAAPAEHYWEDGPEFTGWGEAAAKYPDGTPAVVQGAVGEGWMVLAGVHPEAPESWRAGMAFAMPAATANAYALQLIEAALEGRRLAAF